MNDARPDHSDTPRSRPRLIDRVRTEIRTRHYSIRTEDAYVGWIRRFLHFYELRHPRDMGADEINRFLSHLAQTDHVAVSTQNQALSALLFLYRNVLKMDLPWLDEIVRARPSKHLPTVLSREEASAIIARLDGVTQLIVLMLYGTGMRILECLRLRVKDIDFDLAHLRIHNAKGGKDRVTMLPNSVRDRLKEHMAQVKTMHDQDLAEGYGSVHMPTALDRKFRGAEREWKWQYVFPAGSRGVDPRTGKVRRHHLHTHILNCSGGRGVVSPADRLHKVEFMPSAR